MSLNPPKIGIKELEIIAKGKSALDGIKLVGNIWGLMSDEDRFNAYDQALKKRGGYGCATDDEWAEHKRLFMEKTKKGGLGTPVGGAIGYGGGGIIHRGYQVQRDHQKAIRRCKKKKPKGLEGGENGLNRSQNTSSPIILDLDNDGVETSAVDYAVRFDHDENGFAESTGWVGKGDGLLVRDLDSNGYIEGGQELFGNNTLLSNGEKAANGFEALIDLDSVENGGNADGVLDSNDELWSTLKVWEDSDGDGITGEGELLTLEDAGVASMDLAYTQSSHVDVMVINTNSWVHL